MTVRSWQLDEETGDLAIVSGKSIGFVSDLDAIRQALKFRLQMVLGEWFLNTDAGMDWFGTIYAKGASDADIEAEVRRVCLGTSGVSAVDSVTITRQPSVRKAQISVQGRADSGQLLQTTVTLG